jgi:hypothetical protein
MVGEHVAVAQPGGIYCSRSWWRSDRRTPSPGVGEQISYRHDEHGFLRHSTAISCLIKISDVGEDGIRIIDKAEEAKGKACQHLDGKTLLQMFLDNYIRT